MDRPEITDEMILEAAKQVAEKLNGDPKSIAANYCHPMDGYQLGRELDRWCGWDLTMSDVEELDCMSSIVDSMHREAEKKWFAENDIQPPLPLGTTIKEGVITGICEHSAARYLVKENGCTRDGRWLLIKFEDAVSV